MLPFLYAEYTIEVVKIRAENFGNFKAPPRYFVKWLLSCN